MHMEFHSKLLQPLPDQRVRGWNGPLPFYMAYPGYFGPAQEAALVQDLDYLQQTYPAQVSVFSAELRRCWIRPIMKAV